MSKITRSFVVLSSILIVGAWFGGSAIASTQGKRVAFVTTPNAQPYIGTWTSSFKKKAKALGIKTTFFVSPFDPALQAQQINEAIGQKFDLIVLVTINHEAIIPALTRAKAAGIPVMLVVDPILPKDRKLFMSYVGTDQTRLGALAAENLVKGLALEGKSHGQVVAITGTATQMDTIDRMHGFRATLAKHPGIKLVDVGDAHWQTAPSEKIAGQMLVRYAQHGGIAGFYGMADNQAAAIIRAVQDAGLKVGVKSRGVVVVGSACEKVGIMNIRKGLQYSTNTQLPTEEAAAAVKYAAEYFNGKKLKKYEIVPSFGITRANVSRFAKACSY